MSEVSDYWKPQLAKADAVVARLSDIIAKQRAALEAALPYIDNSESPGGCNGKHADCGQRP